MLFENRIAPIVGVEPFGRNFVSATLFLYPSNNTVGALREFYTELCKSNVSEKAMFEDSPPLLKFFIVADLARWLLENQGKDDNQLIPDLGDLTIRFVVDDMRSAFGGSRNGYLITVEPCRVA